MVFNFGVMSSLSKGNDRRNMTSDSAMLRNASRRLERDNYRGAAQEMAMQAEKQKMVERMGRASGARSAEEEVARNRAELQTRRAMVEDTADAYGVNRDAQVPAAPALDNREGQNPIAVLNSSSQSPAPTNGSGFSSRPSSLRDNSFTRESFADTDRRRREELTAAGAFGRGAQRAQEQRMAAESAPKPEARISQPMRKSLDPMVGAARGLVEDEKAAKQKAINDAILAPMRAERAAKEQAEAANKAQVAERSTSRSLLRDSDKMTGASSGAAVLESARKSTPTMDKVAALKNIGDSSEALLANQSALDEIDMGLADNTDFGGSLDRSKIPTVGDALLRRGVASITPGRPGDILRRNTRR